MAAQTGPVLSLCPLFVSFLPGLSVALQSPHSSCLLDWFLVFLIELLVQCVLAIS